MTGVIDSLRVSERTSCPPHLSTRPEHRTRSTQRIRWSAIAVAAVALLLLTGCPPGGDPPLYSDGTIVIQVLNAYDYETGNLIGYVFPAGHSVADLDGALGCGVFPGSVWDGQAEVEICDGTGAVTMFSGGTEYLAYGFLDGDGDGQITEGDSMLDAGHSVFVDGDMIVTLHYPADFTTILPDPGPRIEVTMGDVATVPSPTVPFGSAPLAVSNPVVFTISNPGDEPLELTGVPGPVAITGLDAGQFLLTLEPATTVAAGAATMFTVDFTPGSDGPKTAEISIAHNGLSASPFLLSLTGTGISPPARIPATGATASHAVGDDGDLERGVAWLATRFSVPVDGTITDSLSGLMWQQTPSGTTRTWADTMTYVATVATGGHTDWRLPNIHELASLLNASTYDNEGWLEGAGFTNLQEDYYWSSTTLAADTDYAWAVDLGPVSLSGTWGHGCIEDLRKTGEYNQTNQLVLFRAWCVRDGGSGTIALPKTGQTTSQTTGDDGDLERGVEWPSPRFIDNGNGTVTDALTGLMWDQSPGGPTVTWATAVANAADQTTAGYSDWRLPNRWELRSLIDFGITNTAAWLNGLEFDSIYEFHYWTSTPYPAGSDYTWITFMTQGQTLWEYKVPGSGFWKPVWYVRGGD